MIAAKPTADEAQRLKELYDYDILDSGAEKVFDDLTQLASQICGTPITVISLVDADRQWFKSIQGLDAQETPRELAFCAHAIHEREIFEVPDATQDERFKDNPLVTGEPNIRFYAGAQLVSPRGHAIGTLCAISDEPAKLTDMQKNALEILGREVISQLELRKKIREAERANQHKTDFLSNLSHELRTPLNSILSFGKLLANSPIQNLSAEQQEYVECIDYSAQRLLDMLNGFLDLQKIEAGKMELQPAMINIRELFHSLIGLFEVDAKAKQIELSLTVAAEVDKYVFLDEVRFGQIVINLANNAIKFCRTGKRVEVTLHQHQNTLTLVVRDQGLGIPESEQGRVFEKYERLQSHHKTQGSGLGLPITLSLVQLMGGDLKLSSIVGKGTLIKVTLPLGETPDNRQPEDVSAAQEVAKFNRAARILVVEDNHINQLVASAVFKSIGLTVALCDSGEAALVATEAERFDLIFMDLNMPGMDGFECTRQILQRHPKQLVVCLSADVFAPLTNETEPPLFVDSLTKPIEFNKLIKILNNLVPL